MRLSEELLDIAEYLLRQNKNKPTDSAIRRAISTAYYALFHHLIEEATTHLVATPSQQQALARSFDHGKMRKVCEGMKSAPPILAAVLGGPVPDELKQVAAAFVELQDRRHDADYNLARNFKKLEARDFVSSIKETLGIWKQVPAAVARPFLLLLLTGEPKAR